MSVLPTRARRTLVALAALAGLMLTTGQSCADASRNSQGLQKSGSSTKANDDAGKNKSGTGEYDEYGYDQAGYDRDGYDRHGYDKYGYDCDGYNRYGYDRDGYDRHGYDANGLDDSGCNRAGYDRDGDRCGSGSGHDDKDRDNEA